MRTAFVAILVIVVLILGGVGGYYLGYQRLLPRLSFVPANSPTSIPSRVGGAAATPEASSSGAVSTPSPTPTPAVAPQTVVDSFMKSFTQITTTSTTDPNAKQAVQFLTQDAQKVVVQESNGNLSSGLAKFAGVQSVPDGGYTVGKPTQNGNTVVIATTWNYLSGPVTKVFYLIVENGAWKIDTIRDK